MLLLGAVLLVVGVNSRLEGIVDNHFAVDLVVVESLDDLGHRNDARHGETVLSLDLLLSDASRHLPTSVEV